MFRSIWPCSLSYRPREAHSDPGPPDGCNPGLRAARLKPDCSRRESQLDGRGKCLWHSAEPVGFDTVPLRPETTPPFTRRGIDPFLQAAEQGQARRAAIGAKGRGPERVAQGKTGSAVRLPSPVLKRDIAGNPSLTITSTVRFRRMTAAFVKADIADSTAFFAGTLR